VFKEEQVFLGRREKMIKGGWRHGITGVEDPSASSSVFYSEKQQAKIKREADKDFINNRRRECKNKNPNRFQKSISGMAHATRLNSAQIRSNVTPLFTAKANPTKLSTSTRHGKLSHLSLAAS
jgi:hypothetical protein